LYFCGFLAFTTLAFVATGFVAFAGVFSFTGSTQLPLPDDSNSLPGQFVCAEPKSLWGGFN
jgi:hypothetical protein